MEEEKAAAKLEDKTGDWWEDDGACGTASDGDPFADADAQQVRPAKSAPSIFASLHNKPKWDESCYEWDLKTQRERSPFYSFLDCEIVRGKASAETMEREAEEEGEDDEPNPYHNPSLLKYLREQFIAHAAFRTQIMRHPFRYASDKDDEGAVRKSEQVKVRTFAFMFWEG